MSSWEASLAHALPAMLITIVGLRLHQVSRDRKTSRSDAVLAELFLGLATIVALVLWFQVFVSAIF